MTTLILGNFMATATSTSNNQKSSGVKQPKKFKQTFLSQMLSDNNKRVYLSLGVVAAIGTGMVAYNVLSGSEEVVTIEESSLEGVNARATELNEEQRKFLDAEDQARAEAQAAEAGSSVVSFNIHGQEVLTAKTATTSSTSSTELQNKISAAPESYEEIQTKDGQLYVREKTTGQLYDPNTGAQISNEEASQVSGEATTQPSYFRVDEAKMAEVQAVAATNQAQSQTTTANTGVSASPAVESGDATTQQNPQGGYRYAQGGGQSQQSQAYNTTNNPNATYQSSYGGGSGGYGSGGYQDPNGYSSQSYGYQDQQQDPNAGLQNPLPYNPAAYATPYNGAYNTQLNGLQQDRALAQTHRTEMHANRAGVAEQRTSFARQNVQASLTPSRTGPGFGHTRYELTNTGLYGNGAGNGSGIGGVNASAGSFATNWVEANQRTAVGTNSVVRPEEDVDVYATGGGSVSTTGAIGGKLAKSAIREGTLWRVVTTKTVDTGLGDNTIRGRVIGGEYNGATVLGVIEWNTSSTNIGVRWNRLIPVDQRAVPIIINASALSLNANNFHSRGVATDVNNHYFRNYTGALLESVVEGYGNAYSRNNGTTTIERSDGTIITTNEGEVSSKEIRASVASSMSDRIRNDVSRIGNRPRTVRIEIGTVLDMHFDETVNP